MPLSFLEIHSTGKSVLSEEIVGVFMEYFLYLIVIQQRARDNKEMKLKKIFLGSGEIDLKINLSGTNLICYLCVPRLTKLYMK